MSRRDITAADLFDLDKAHDRVVWATRLVAKYEQRHMRRADASLQASLYMAEQSWDCVMGRLRERLNGGPL